MIYNDYIELSKKEQYKGCLSLWSSVITQAYEDLNNKELSIRKDAYYFFYSDDFKYVLKLAGWEIDHNKLLDKIREHRFVEYMNMQKYKKKCVWLGY